MALVSEIGSVIRASSIELGLRLGVTTLVDLRHFRCIENINIQDKATKL